MGRDEGLRLKVKDLDEAQVHGVQRVYDSG